MVANEKINKLLAEHPEKCCWENLRKTSVRRPVRKRHQFVILPSNDVQQRFVSFAVAKWKQLPEEEKRRYESEAAKEK